MSITRFDIKSLSIYNSKLYIYKRLSNKIHVINLNEINKVYIKSNFKKKNRLLMIVIIIFLILILFLTFSFSYIYFITIFFCFLSIVANYRNYFITIKLKDKSVFKLFFFQAVSIK